MRQQGTGAVRQRARTAFLISALVTLTACAQTELVLDGERFDLRDSEPATAAPRAFAPPAPINHNSWTHRGGSAAHKITHPALARAIAQVWSVDIGQGNSRKARISADPVALDGRIFAMDSAAKVTAVNSDGAILWTRQLSAAADGTGEFPGGGLAVSDRALIVTTGFGEVYALNPADGAELWRQRLEAPVTSAPTISDGLVFLVSRDSRAWAIDIEQGRIRWQLPGTPASTNFDRGAGPAVTGRAVVFPFGSGELVSALKLSGIRVWGSSVAGQRLGRASAFIPDLSADPVVHNGIIYAANQSGRAAALDAVSGERLWSAAEGAYSPLWPSGDSVFLVSDQAELIRLEAESGARIWGVRLPYFEQQRLRRRSSVFAHYGPILAGGRLIVPSGDGVIRQFDPETGAPLADLGLRGGAASNPIVVDGTLYIVSASGQLAAFR